MHLSLIFLSVSDWLEANGLTLGIAFLGYLGTVGTLVWKMSQWQATSEATKTEVKALALAFQKHVDEVEDHIKDSSVHTTFEQRQAINARLDKIEASVQNGHIRIENKLDKITDWMLKK